MFQNPSFPYDVRVSIYLQISYDFFSKTAAIVHLITQDNVQKASFPYELLVVFGVHEGWRLIPVIKQHGFQIILVQIS
jgi:hypothetical protein